ncbi:MAG: hypothetical protein IJJ63_03545 [Bacilli bacterium]|nr:hypothetical protein [Bacilli bacterium]
MDLEGLLKMYGDIQTQIEGLIKKADNAQNTGNTSVMAYYDSIINSLRQESNDLLKEIYSLSVGNVNEPKTR